MTTTEWDLLTPEIKLSLLFKVEGAVGESILTDTHPLLIALRAGFFCTSHGLLDITPVCLLIQVQYCLC